MWEKDPNSIKVIRLSGGAKNDKDINDGWNKISWAGPRPLCALGRD